MNKMFFTFERSSKLAYYCLCNYDKNYFLFDGWI